MQVIAQYLMYIDILYVVMVWLGILAFMRWERIILFLKTGLISVILLFAVEVYSITLNLYNFPDPLWPVFNIPFWHLVWGFSSGIFYAHWVFKRFWKNVVLILVFALITRCFGSLQELVGEHIHLNFTHYHNYLQDVVILSLFTFILRGVYPIYVFRDKLKEKHSLYFPANKK